MSAVVGGVGAGVGALFARRPRIVLYQAEPSGATEPSQPAVALLPAGLHAGALPAPLREAYRVFSAEEAARQLAPEWVRERASVPVLGS